MNLEGGYFLTPQLESRGHFLDFHTNHKYVPRQTITEGTASLTTDRQESAFQLPFGLAASYRFISNGCLKPYDWHQDRNHVCPKYNISEYYKSDR